MASIYLTQNEWYQSPALGNADMGGNTIENLAAPVAASDAVTKQYADSLAGGINPSQWATFPAVANVNMNISTITNLKPPVNIGDAANKGYCDSTASAAASAASALWAASPASQDVNMNSHQINNLIGGTADNSAVNYGQLQLTAYDCNQFTLNELQNWADAPAVNNLNMNGKNINNTASINANNMYILNTGSGDSLRIDDQASDTTYFRIDADGRCGIRTGATTLSQALRVKGDSLLEGVVSCSLGGSSTGWYKGIDVAWYLGGDAKYPLITSSHPGGLYVKRTGNTNQVSTQLSVSADVGGVPTSQTGLHIHHTGQVGIGTELPQAKLHIVQTDAQDAFRIDDQASDTTYFKIDENGRCGVNTGSTALTSALTVSGAVDVMNNKITGVATPTNSNDAANKAYVDSVSGGSGWSQYPATQTVNMNYQKISNVANPVDAYDVATRAYVDQQLIPPERNGTKHIYVESSLDKPTTNITIDFNSASINFNNIVVTIRLLSNSYYKQIYFANYDSPSLIGKRITLMLTNDSVSGSYCNVFAPDGGTYILQNIGGYNKAIELMGGGIGDYPLTPYWRVVVSTT